MRAGTNATMGVATAQAHLGAAAQRVAISLAVLGGFAFLLQDRIRALDLALAVQVVQAVQPLQWLGALFATTISFWAIGRYDGVVHQHLGTAIRPAEARRAGLAAIAVSQTVGAGVFTGALIRWRMLRGVSLWQATRLSMAVTLSFLAGWAVVTGAVLTALSQGALGQLGLLMLGGGAVVFGLGLWQPHAFQRLGLPNALTQGRLIVLTLVDTFAACLALFLLLPGADALPFLVLLPAFLLALGAGLASGTPGGVGPFEVTLIGLLPAMPDAALLGAIMAWRLVYFAIPALIGAALAAHGPAANARGAEPALRRVTPQRQGGLIAQSPRAEGGLARQGQLSIMESRLGAAWIVGRTGHALIGLFDPIGTDQPQRAALRVLAAQAQSEGRVAAIYKCSARTAAMARGLGWQACALGSEAVVNPLAFSLMGPKLSALRRKLRRAEAAGITLHCGNAQGAAERAAVARLWARARKGERGFSMGRYAEPYIATQLVIEARQAGRLVAFATFHKGPREWTLDLMRILPDSPDGTMQAIVTHAILLAQGCSLPRLSLAAAGAPPALPPLLSRWFKADDAGLHRFKQMFGPVWQARYMVAPSRRTLLLAGVEVARAVHAPARLQ